MSNNKFGYYDVIVVGAGHAGVEAAYAAAKRGSVTLLITISFDDIGKLSCNPAAGGVGRSQLVKDIDALGGLMGICIDKSAIHIKVLNTSKGEAVHSTRGQLDRGLYQDAVNDILTNQPNLYIIQAETAGLLINNDKIYGIQIITGDKFFADAVVLTTGTFLSSSMRHGSEKIIGGRLGAKSSDLLAANLEALLGGNLMRLRTGTPPRIDGKTVDFSKLTRVDSDNPLPYVSQWQRYEHPVQKPNYFTYTNSATHDLIRKYTHVLKEDNYEDLGPSFRYCTSLEQKVLRFHEQTHQIILEPEGLKTSEYYLKGAGLYTSYSQQTEIIRTIRGLEKAHITRSGYLVTYLAHNPKFLDCYLQTRIAGLFLAGQINGTTGYEEAAGQGIIAGINASLYAAKEPLFTLDRDESYIGVMISDITLKGVSEPYRMFTSRAENRLMLRQDNAIYRLGGYALKLGLLNKSQADLYLNNSAIVQKLRTELESNMQHGVSLFKLVGLGQLLITDLYPSCDLDIAYHLTVEAKYAPYVEKHKYTWDKIINIRDVKIPKNIDYYSIHNLSIEIKDRLHKIRPATLKDVVLIEGVTPVAIAILDLYLGVKDSNLVN